MPDSFVQDVDKNFEAVQSTVSIILDKTRRANASDTQNI